MKVKENERNMAIVSEALILLGKGTTKQLAQKTNMTRSKVQHTLSEMKRKGYAENEEKTGHGSETIWTSVRKFEIKNDKEIDWRMYHYVFHNLVSLRNAS